MKTSTTDTPPVAAADESVIIIATGLGPVTTDSVVKVVASVPSAGEAKKKLKDPEFLQSVASTHFDNGAFTLYVVPQKLQKTIQSKMTFVVSE